MDDEIRALVDAALDVNLKFPRGIALDENTLYVADTSNNVIRQVDLATGNSTIIAGTGMAGFSGDGADATKARLNSPYGLVIDNDGNLIIADSDNRRIRKLDFSTGIITTIAGTGMPGSAGDGGQAKMAQLTFPRALAMDSAGNLFLVDNDANKVRKIDRNGVITTVAGNGQAGFSGDGGQAAMASLNLPKSIVVDGSGNLFIADTENDRIRRVDVQTGIITTIAGTGVTGFSGDGGNATQAKLSSPHGLALDDDGNLFVLDTFNNAIRAMKVSRSGANAADFSLTVSPASQNIQVGDSATFRVGFNALNNFNGSVALNTSVTPVNSGISLNLSSSNISGSQTATLMVNVASNATTGTFNIAVTGQSGTITRQEMIRLVVTPKPPGDFALAVRPTVQSVPLGAATSFTLNTQAINGFTDAISLNASVEPANSGLSLMFSNNSIAPGNNSTLTVNASSSAALGDFNVTINGTSGQIVRSQVVKLSVVQMLRPPKITPIADQMVKSGDVINLAVTTMDADPTGLALSIVSAPGYVALTDNGNGNGMIRIAPPMNAQSGTVTLRAINAGGLTDQISFQVIVAGGVNITNATFAKPILTISGMGFQTSGAIVRVNDVDVSRNIRSQTDTKIELKGNKKKLSLKKGQNTVVVVINGVVSNSVTFNF
ncbi:MAG: hypothetical protein IPK14_23690 [Blastocatellia bacterium]|nr:hypothetical protein [Blastocatellia bacterium]